MRILLKDLPKEIQENLENYVYINNFNPKILDIRYKFERLHNKLFYKNLCEVCGNEFFVNHSTILTCTEICQKIYRKKTKKFLNNLPLFLLNNIEKYKKNNNLKEVICIHCKKLFLVDKKDNGYFCTKSCQISYSNIFSQSRKDKSSKRMIENNPSKQGTENVCYKGKKDKTFDFWAEKIGWHDEVRRCPDNENILEVKCTYCGKWHIPEWYALNNRASRIDKDFSKIYCSQECKDNCPTYSISGARINEKSLEHNSSREVQAQLRKLVLERDNWTCQKCGQHGGSLHCHHIDPVINNPIESADINNCITLCKDCHKYIHMTIDGCGYAQLRCIGE